MDGDHDIATVASVREWVVGRTVPPMVPAILFLAGDLSEEDANLRLNGINEAATQGFAPWHLGSSFSHALREAYVAGSETSDEASLFVENYSY